MGTSRQFILLKSQFFVILRVRWNDLVEVPINDFVTVVSLNRISLQLPTKTYKEME